MLSLPSVRSTRSDADHPVATAFAVSIVTVVALSAIVLSIAGAAAPVSGNGSTTHTAADAQAQDEPALTVTDAHIQPNDEAQFDVALSAIPEGLAGFVVTLAVTDPEVAEITGAEYPDSYGHTTDPRISENGSEITVEAVDLRDQVGSGDTDVGLATVTVRGQAAGQTSLQVTDYQIDADGGDRVEPALDPGNVTVSDATSDGARSSPEGAATESDGGGGQAETTSATSDGGLDGVTILLVVGALGVLVVALWIGTTDRVSWP